MAKKKTEEVKEEIKKEVKTPITEKTPTDKKIKLKIEISFNDKYTNDKYKVSDIVSFEEKRAVELLADPRKLVSKV